MAKVAYDGKLVERIKALRGSLGLSQRHFSEYLGVSASQVSRWEKGTEWPSNEKLIALGNLSPLSVGLWFWRRAGLDTQAVEEAVLRELTRMPDESTLAKAVRIPRLDVAALLKELRGGETDELEPVDSIPLPSLFVPEPASTICVQVPEWARGPLLFAGDLALIRRTPVPLALLRDRLVAILFERRPNMLMPVSWISPAREDTRRVNIAELEKWRNEMERQEEGERETNRFLAEATSPGILFGMLRIGSDAAWNKHLSSLGPEHPWRLFLEYGDYWEPLSKWSTEVFPSEATSIPDPRDGSHLVGAVITWISSSAIAPQRSVDEIRPEAADE